MAELFDPKRHKVWRVEYEIRGEGFAVAETGDEAWEAVRAGVEVSMRDAQLRRARPTTKALGGPDGDGLPWGSIEFHGKELRLNQAIALTQGGQYDTSTELMPFVDAPPPLRGEPPHPALKDT